MLQRNQHSEVPELVSIAKPTRVITSLWKTLKIIFGTHEIYIFFGGMVVSFLYNWQYNPKIVTSSPFDVHYDPLFATHPVVSIGYIFPLITLAISFLISGSKTHIVTVKQILKGVVIECKNLKNSIRQLNMNLDDAVHLIHNYPEELRISLIHHDARLHETSDEQTLCIFKSVKQLQHMSDVKTKPDKLIGDFRNSIRKKIQIRSSHNHLHHHNTKDPEMASIEHHIQIIYDRSKSLLTLEPEHISPVASDSIMIGVYVVILTLPNIMWSHLSWYWGTFYATATVVVIIGCLVGSRTRRISNELAITTDAYEWYHSWSERIVDLCTME